jgi:FkbM family methyltransferase
VIDVGAHLGEFSLQLSRRFRCQCHAIEASPALFSQIADDPLVRKYNFAVSDHNGPFLFYLSENPEAGTLSKPPNADGIRSVVVQGITFGTFLAKAGIDSIDLLKIDIEGGEIGLLGSLDSDILSRTTQITVEFHDFLPARVSPGQVQEIKQKLATAGFYEIKLSRSYNTDVLFINKRRSRISTMEHWYMSRVEYWRIGLGRFIGGMQGMDRLRRRCEHRSGHGA